MIKKYFIGIMYFFGINFFCYTQVLAITGINANLNVAADPQTLTQTTAKVSAFVFNNGTDSPSVNLSTNSVTNTARQTIVRFTLNSNTRDGYQVFLKSQNDGALTSATSDDGESQIPYNLQMTTTSNSSVPTNANNFTNLASITNATLAADNANNNGFIILGNPVGTTVVPATTSGTFEITLAVEDAGVGPMSMAGTYTDELTFTFADI